MKERLLAAIGERKNNRWLCGQAYDRECDGDVCVNEMGRLIKPHDVTEQFSKLLDANSFRHICFHDLRRPYVKATTKIFSAKAETPSCRFRQPVVSVSLIGYLMH